MMIRKYDRDEDQVPPLQHVQQELPEGSQSSCHDREEPVPEWCKCGCCYIMPVNREQML